MSDLRLDTSRLCLRLMQPSDLDDLLKIFGDYEVMASFGGATFNRDQIQRWIQRNLEHQTLHGYGLFLVILKSEEVLIGDCGFEHAKVGGDQAIEIGYDFRSDYWNQGLASEIANAVLDYALNILYLPGLSQTCGSFVANFQFDCCNVSHC